MYCRPNYFLKDGICTKCKDSDGYDPIAKECFVGMPMSEFIETQFGNLKAVTTDIELENNYFLATYRYSVSQSTYSHNGFVLFSNNVENYNRMMDYCWDQACLAQDHGIYFAFGNTKQKIVLERFIMGNTGSYTVSPEQIIFSLKTKDLLEINSPKHKNFDCSIFGDYFFQPIDIHFGKCTQNCDTSYYKDFNTQRCVKCHSSCRTCLSEKICLTCNRTYVLVLGECLPCQTPCITCNKTQNHCLSCKSSNMFNEVDFNCNKLCSTNTGCKNCDIYSGRCYVCKDGYELADGLCQATNCGIPNCTLCNVDGKTCKRCATGYSLTEGKCVVCSTKCEVCPVGYELTNQTCVNLGNSLKSSSIMKILSLITLLILYKD